MKKVLGLLLLTTLAFSVDADNTPQGKVTSSGDKYKTKKTSCILQSNYPEKKLDELKSILLDKAKQEALVELYGHMIYTKTDIKNGQIENDEVRQRAIGAVRVEGTPKYYNGQNFGEVCVDVNAYVTKKDIEKYSPKKIELKHFCYANPDVAVSQVKTKARAAGYIETLVQVKPSLKSLQPEQAEKLIHGFTISNDSFDFDTGAYCYDAVATILPYELELGGVIQKSTGKNTDTMQDNGIITLPSKDYARSKSIFYIGEPWGDTWYVDKSSTGKIINANQNFGWHNASQYLGHAMPPPNANGGLLYIHPVSQNEPALVRGKFKVNRPHLKLKLRVAGNQNGDWQLKVLINNTTVRTDIIGYGWRTIEIPLDSYANQWVNIDLLSIANNWFYEYTFIDSIDIVEDKN